MLTSSKSPSISSYSTLGITGLTFATMIWGLGFIGTRWTLIDYGPTWSNALRFVAALIFSIPFLIKTHKRVPLIPALSCGVMLFMALQLQTMGLSITTVAKSGFFTVFYALFTPLIIMILYKTKLTKHYLLSLILSLFGVALLCELDIKSFNLGDFYTLLSAFIFSIHIILIDKLAKNVSSLYLNIYQIIVVAFFSLIFAFINEGTPDLKLLLTNYSFFGSNSLNGIFVTAILSSFFAFALQMHSQKYIKPHLVSLIFLFESIFAAIFGYLFLNEMLSTMAICGCIVILISISSLFLNKSQWS